VADQKPIVRFSWKLSEWKKGTRSIRFANFIGTNNNPSFESSAVIVDKPEGQIEVTISKGYFGAAYPHGFF
jgi:hypothetical protein